MKQFLLFCLVSFLSLAVSGSLFAEGIDSPVDESVTVSTATVFISIEDLAVGTGVMDRVIHGSSTTFSAAAVERVVCFTKVLTNSIPTVVRHVWTREGSDPTTVELNVGGSPWRIWSSRHVEPGAWTVNIQDENGSVVESIAFTVVE